MKHGFGKERRAKMNSVHAACQPAIHPNFNGMRFSGAMESDVNFDQFFGSCPTG